jgi:glycosyl transferase, family 25
VTKVPVYYINLDARTDRRVFMEAQFRSKGIAAARLPAVTAEEAARARLKDTRIAARFSDVEVACNLSHRKAWEAVLESGAPAAAILEDDAVLGAGFETVLDWDSYSALSPSIVRLETFLRLVRLGSRAVTISPGFVARYMVSAEAGSAAYIISREAAKLALGDSGAGNLLMDGYLFGNRGPFLHKRRVVQVSPSPCVQAFKVAELKVRSVAASDLTASREMRFRAGGPFRATLKHLVQRRLAIARWLLDDPAILLGRPAVVPFSGNPKEIATADD